MGEREQAAQERRRKSGFKLKLRPNGRRLLSGAIAGAFSRTAVAPLETIRTHLMVGTHGHSLPEIFHWIITNKGWPGLFRGNTINVIRVAPSKAIEHDQLFEQLLDRKRACDLSSRGCSDDENGGGGGTTRKKLRLSKE
ncbi:unnamed protein product [Sphagnum jensenii]|uniref:Uncharacterized protein n=1 Tax=Sphagnum jensenii TaxID=128206 RepID=A0ABP1AIM1_9BRYO